MRDVTDLNEYRTARRRRLRLVHPAQGSLRLLSADPTLWRPAPDTDPQPA